MAITASFEQVGRQQGVRPLAIDDPGDRFGHQGLDAGAAREGGLGAGILKHHSRLPLLRLLIHEPAGLTPPGQLVPLLAGLSEPQATSPIGQEERKAFFHELLLVRREV
jgi:hypothetical protein